MRRLPVVMGSTNLNTDHRPHQQDFAAGGAVVFGSVFKIRPKPGKFDAIMEMNQREYRERGTIAGWQSSHVLRESSGDVWILAIFDSEDSYRKNAASPDQDKRYRQLREMIEADPEWHDGTIREERPA
jgi:hypothetical protein